MGIRPLRRYLEYTVEEEILLTSLNFTTALRLIRIFMPKMVLIFVAFGLFALISDLDREETWSCDQYWDPGECGEVELPCPLCLAQGRYEPSDP